MIRKALVAMFCIVCSVLLSQDVTVMAQDVRTTRAKYISQADIQKGLGQVTASLPDRSQSCYSTPFGRP